MSFKTYTFNILIATDQLANTVFNGLPDETISSRMYRASKHSKCANVARKVLDFIFSPWGKNHCQEAYESEINREHLFKESNNRGNTSNS